MYGNDSVLLTRFDALKASDALIGLFYMHMMMDNKVHSAKHFFRASFHAVPAVNTKAALNYDVFRCSVPF